jgi:hypothetical protein
MRLVAAAARLRQVQTALDLLLVQVATVLHHP